MNAKLGRKIKLGKCSARAELADLAEDVNLDFEHFFRCTLMEIVGRFMVVLNIYKERSMFLLYCFEVIPMIAMQILSRVTGIHLNPAFTISAIVLKQTKIINILFYPFVQLLGACLSYALIYFICSNTSLGSLKIWESIQVLGAFKGLCLEFCTTFLFVGTYCMLLDKTDMFRKNPFQIRHLAIVGAVLLITVPFIIGVNIDALNIIRMLSSALCNVHFQKGHWIFAIGPHTALDYFLKWGNNYLALVIKWWSQHKVKTMFAWNFIVRNLMNWN